jgi:hypothetical protein
MDVLNILRDADVFGVFAKMEKSKKTRGKESGHKHET